METIVDQGDEIEVEDPKEEMAKLKPVAKGVTLDQLRIDPDAARDGVWREYAPGVRIRIAMMNNPRFDAYVTEKLRPYAEKYRVLDEQIPKAIESEITRDGVAHTIMTEIDGLVGDDGEPVVLTPEIARSMIDDPGLPDLYNFVMWWAGRRSEFRRIAVEASLGN